jgi:hypothetical protein
MLRRKTRKIHKRLTRESLANVIRRPNAASSNKKPTPFWAYSLKCHSTKKGRKTKKLGNVVSAG